MSSVSDDSAAPGWLIDEPVTVTTFDKILAEVDGDMYPHLTDFLARSSGAWKATLAERDELRAEVARVTDERDNLRRRLDERVEADCALIAKYRNHAPGKTGAFQFPDDVAAIIRHFETEVARLREAGNALLAILDGMPGDEIEEDDAGTIASARAALAADASAEG